MAIVNSTWRIIPFSKWLVTMVIVSPLSMLVPLLNGLFMAYTWGAILTTYKSWDDPPSRSKGCRKPQFSESSCA